MWHPFKIPNGTYLSTALDQVKTRLDSDENGWMHCFGEVEFVEVNESPSALAGPFFIRCEVMLMPDSVEIFGSLSDRAGATQYQGRIRNFKSLGCTGRLTQSNVDSIVLGDGLTNKPKVLPTEKIATPAPLSWDDLAQLSSPKNESMENRAASPAESVLGKSAPSFSVNSLRLGDVLMHPHFGRCKVVRAPSGGKLKVRKPNGAFADLHLKVIRIERSEEQNGARIYYLEIAGPK